MSSKKITVIRDLETTTKEIVTIEVSDHDYETWNKYLDEEFDPFNYKVIEERTEIEETHEWGSWEIASVWTETVEPEKVEPETVEPITWETIVQSWDSPPEEFVAPTIQDGMTAEGVWVVINDILDSIFHAADAKAFNEVRDYVGNVYGEEEA